MHSLSSQPLYVFERSLFEYCAAECQIKLGRSEATVNSSCKSRPLPSPIHFLLILIPYPQSKQSFAPQWPIDRVLAFLCSANNLPLEAESVQMKICRCAILMFFILNKFLKSQTTYFYMAIPYLDIVCTHTSIQNPMAMYIIFIPILSFL